MKLFNITTGIALIMGLTACGSAGTVARYAPLTTDVVTSETVSIPRDYNVVDIRVNVPETLEVSEANRYLPVADIVWRGDPYGNRYEQIEAIFETGMTRGAAQLTGSRDVIVDIEVIKFHSLTEKTRYSFGGVHNIKFSMTVRDAETGVVIEEPHIVSANLDGFGGKQAIEADRIGQTQKVRITDHLSRVIVQELSTPV